jgi:hypothetical protein
MDGGSLRIFLRGSILVAAAAATLGFCSAAQAAIVTVGSPSLSPLASVNIGNPTTIFNSATGQPGANLTSPISGTVIRWNAAGFKGGPFRLRVLTPLGANNYTGGGTSAPQTVTSTAKQTFATSLPIKAGQMIALDNTNAADEIGYIASATGSYSYFNPPLAEGSTRAATGPITGIEFTFNAEVQPLPGISAVSPAAGSIKGGTSVLISGHDFTGATGVSFGTSPAKSFSVQSENTITAVAPANADVGSVTISVTTLAGKATAPQSFTYEACSVPKLKGKKLKGAKKTLRAAGCKIGKVKKKEGATAKTGVVVKQHPTPRTLLVPGAKVNVTLGS